MLENLTEVDRVIDKKMIASMAAAKSAQFVQNMEALPREAANVANFVSQIDFVSEIFGSTIFSSPDVEKKVC